MGNIIDMASFEHLRRSNTSDRYTCPITNITFPAIYKILVPDGEIVDDTPIFTGKFRTEYKLKESVDSGASILPGFPPSVATKISTLNSDDAIYLDVIHFTNKDQALGFRNACAHLGIEPEHVSRFKDNQGVFILLRREGEPKKKSHIIYRSSKSSFIEALRCEMECEYVAAFNHVGEIVRLEDIEDCDEH